MQRYYRAAKLVRQVNTILLQNLHARLYPAATQPVPIDASSSRSTSCSTCATSELFVQRPAAMLDAFLMLQKHRELQGMTARTLRALWRDRQLIDGAFRRDPANRARFMAMFRAERGLLHELRRMNLFGILGQYLPVFGRIVGQMQHDLFHVYTVDEHILMVIRNLRRFTEAQHAHEYPLCSRLIADFERRARALHRRTSSTTSRRAAAAITRRSARATRAASAASTAWRTRTPNSSRGWSPTIS